MALLADSGHIEATKEGYYMEMDQIQPTVTWHHKQAESDVCQYAEGVCKVDSRRVCALPSWTLTS